MSDHVPDTDLARTKLWGNSVQCLGLRVEVYLGFGSSS